MLSRSPRLVLICVLIFSILYTVYFISLTFPNGIRQSCREEDEEEDITNALVLSPFLPGQPKLVVLLSYQRSGSTFVGEWFNTNPEVFFNFEPVDSLYSAMYGTKQNQNVPSDITNYRNGTLRQIPDEEIQSVANFLGQYLTCDINRMPTISLINFYTITSYFHSSIADYTYCIRPKFGSVYQACEPFITGFCGSRFGEASETRQKECLQRMWTNQNAFNQSWLVAHGGDFNGYQQCISYIRQKLSSQCQPLLLASCLNHSIRVIKTVRSTMASMEPLLETIPNFRVIHLIRDPRAVALSRKKFPGYVLGHYSGNDSETVVKEAKLYCNTVANDIKIRKELEKKYPGKIYPLVFEEVASNASFYLNRVYRFLDAKPHALTERWLMTKGQTGSVGNKTSNEIADQWQTELTFRMNKGVIENCKEFFQISKHKWVL